MRLDSSWLTRWLGRRSTFLALIAAIYAVVGLGVLVIPTTRFAVGPLLDSPWWGLMWLAAAAVAGGVAVRRRGPDRDWPGFAALLGPPVVWTAFYLVSVAAAVLTGGEFGQLRSVTGVAAWTIDWATVLLVAGWVDPDGRPEPSTST